jgi:hypothetical protein
MGDQVGHSLDSDQSLKRPLEEAAPPQPTLADDSTVIKGEGTEGTERNGTNGELAVTESDAPASKRMKLEQTKESPAVDARDKVHGIALIKPE